MCVMSEFDVHHAAGTHLGASDVASLTSDQYRDLLHSAASFQRGAPESAMDMFQHRVGGSPLSHSLEHVGDLTHRIAERGGRFGIEYVQPKVTSQLHHLLSPYGWRRESHEAIASNRSFRVKRGEDYPDDDEIAGLLSTYRDAHAKVPVYTSPMLSARSAAMEVANRNSRAAAGHLMAIQSSFPDWSEKMRQQASVDFLRKGGRL